MALKIYPYHNNEQLTEHLDRLYEHQKKAQLFGAQPVLISLSQPINRWVNYLLAERHGALLDIPCRLMEEGLWALLREVSPIPLPAAISYQQWLMRIVSLLSDDEFMNQTVMMPLQNYLQNHSQQNVSASKMVSLAQSILLLFQDYEQRNPELIASWPDDPLAQAERELYISSSAGSPCSLGSAFAQLRELSPIRPVDPRLYVILGFPAIQDGPWQILQWAAQAVDIDILQFHPLDDCPSELLMWNRLTQKFLSSVGHSQVAYQPNQPLVALKKLVSDGKLALFSAKGIDREYEAVANHILQLLDRDPNLLPQQIAVLCPDIADVKSQLCTAFDRHHPNLPYCVLGVRAGDSLYVQALQALLALSSEGFTRSQLMAIMRSPCFMQAQGISLGVVDNWQQLMANTGAWRGFDQVETAYEGIKELPFTFKQMLQRYRLGRLMQIPGEHQSDNWQHRIPEAMNRTSTQELEVLGICLDRLDELSDLLSGPDRTTADWSEQLLAMLPTLIQPQPDDATDRRGQSQLMQTLQSLCDSDEPISQRILKASDYKQLLSACIRSESWHLGVPIVGGVNVGSLSQLGGIPFRHVIVCGLNEGSFPRRERATSLDIRIDPNTQSEDTMRQSLLTALFSASDSITLSYQGLNPVADTPGYLSNQLRQLLAYLGVADVAQITRDVPLMPYSSEYVLLRPGESEPAWPNYNRSDWLVALKQLSHNRLAAPELSAQAQSALEMMLVDQRQEAPAHGSAEHPSELSVKQLSSFLYDPIAATLERLAGRVWEDSPEDMADTEPLELSTRQYSSIVTQALRLQSQTDKQLDGFTADIYRAGSHRGLLPVKPIEPVMIAICQQKVNELSQKIPISGITPINARIEIDGVSISADWPLCFESEQGALIAVKLAQGHKKNGQLYPFALVEPALALLVHAMQHGSQVYEVNVLLSWTGDSPSEQFTIMFEPSYLHTLLKHYLSSDLWHMPYLLVNDTGINTTNQELCDEQEAKYNNSIDPVSWIKGITQPDSDDDLRLALHERFAPFVTSPKSREDE